MGRRSCGGANGAILGLRAATPVSVFTALVAGLDTCSFFRLFVGAEADDIPILVVNTLLVSLENNSSADGNSCVVDGVAAGGDDFVSELDMGDISSPEEEEEDAYSSPSKKDAIAAAQVPAVQGNVHTNAT